MGVTVKILDCTAHIEGTIDSSDLINLILSFGTTGPFIKTILEIEA